MEWNFEKLFSSVEDWKKNIKKINKYFENILVYKGKLNNKKKFFEFLEVNEKYNLLFAKLVKYTYLLDKDFTNTKFIEIRNMIEFISNNNQKKLNWIDNELKKINSKKILNWLKDSEKFNKYYYSYQQFYKNKKHSLSLSKENLLSSVSLSRSASEKIYDCLTFADQKYKQYKLNGNKIELSLSNFHKLLKDKNISQKNRVEIAKIFYTSFFERKVTFGQIYNSIIQNLKETVKLRKYKSNLDYSLKRDLLKKKTFLNLLSVAKKNSSVIESYILLKKKYLKYKNFYSVDFFLPLFKYDKNFLISDSLEVIKTILKPLGKEYLSALETATKIGNIDFVEKPTKRQGAYCLGIGEEEPIILMSWINNFSSLLTLIHELGHSCHFLLSTNSKKWPNNDYPLFIAETASMTNEFLVFEHYIENAKSKEEKCYFLQQYIENIIASFFSQAYYSDFEYKVHKSHEENNILDYKKLSKEFNNSLNNFGFKFDNHKFSKELSYSWPRISHFFHVPFYVYNYSIAKCIAFQFFKQIREKKTSNYIKFLKYSGSVNPNELLFSFGIDINKKKFFSDLIKYLKKLINNLNFLLNNKKNV